MSLPQRVKIPTRSLQPSPKELQSLGAHTTSSRKAASCDSYDNKPNKHRQGGKPERLGSKSRGCASAKDDSGTSSKHDKQPIWIGRRCDLSSTLALTGGGTCNYKTQNTGSINWESTSAPSLPSHARLKAAAGLMSYAGSYGENAKLPYGSLSQLRNCYTPRQPGPTTRARGLMESPTRRPKHCWGTTFGSTDCCTRSTTSFMSPKFQRELIRGSRSSYPKSPCRSCGAVLAQSRSARPSSLAQLLLLR